MGRYAGSKSLIHCHVNHIHQNLQFSVTHITGMGWKSHQVADAAEKLLDGGL
jgi:hypothetical protein